MQNRMPVFFLVSASICLNGPLPCDAQETRDNDRGGLVKLTDSSPSLYRRSRVTMQEAPTQFPLVQGMNAERFVEFIKRVDGTFVSFGQGPKYYDIVPEHLFIPLADGHLTVRLVPEPDFDPHAGQPRKGTPKRYGINRMVIDSYFVHAEKRLPDRSTQWKQLPSATTP